MPESPLHEPLLAWYDTHARDLPWRAPDAGAWAVLVSEVMLQQTQVARVLPAYEAWLRRWPTPSALAADAPGDAVRMWGRLGYPRRALRLHAMAVAIDERFDGAVPDDADALLLLPGIGPYTASAVLAFAFRKRAVVLDTNVRRVLARLRGLPPHPSAGVSVAEGANAAAVLPDDPERSARWNVAVMELGALVCGMRRPDCDACPLSPQCVWFAAGRPGLDAPPRRSQGYAGTDRQCRGAILRVLREADEAVARADVDAVWPDAPQRERALTSLLDDGLVVSRGEGSVLALPSGRPQAVAVPPVPGTTSSIGGRSGSSDFMVPAKVNAGSAPESSTSTTTI